MRPRTAAPRAQLPELRPRTAANWFVDRLGCKEAEGEKAAGKLLPHIRESLVLDWRRADATHSALRQLLDLSEAEVRKVVLRLPQGTRRTSRRRSTRVCSGSSSRGSWETMLYSCSPL